MLAQRFLVTAVAAASVFALTSCSIGDEPEAPRWAPAAEAPVEATSPDAEGIAFLADESWIIETADATGIPERALRAYAGAAIEKSRTMPECGLSWNTIAAIGDAESDHGRHDGSKVGDDGTVSPPIYGVALDGDGNIEVPDSDNGELDGDNEHDRAVGPMQLIPQTWDNWHTDANADGVEDPQNIDDASMATANYLCRASGDMTTEKGWRDGIHAFNPNLDYVSSVATIATRFADAVSS